jgi:hypothetical protein
MKLFLLSVAACLALQGCTLYLGRSVAARAEAPASPTAAAKPAAAADHDQLCSQLRADIASSQHNQRAATPSTQAPIIAAATEGKQDQRIEAMQKRYDEMGCVGNFRPEPGSAPIPAAP